MDTDDKAIKTTKIIIEALTYAHSHNLDISKEEDVEKILNVVDTENLFQGDVMEFMKLLHSADTLIEDDVKRRKSIN